MVYGFTANLKTSDLQELCTSVTLMGSSWKLFRENFQDKGKLIVKFKMGRSYGI
jgi:hypothetical protein